MLVGQVSICRLEGPDSRAQQADLIRRKAERRVGREAEPPRITPDLNTAAVDRDLGV